MVLNNNSLNYNEKVKLKENKSNKDDLKNFLKTSYKPKIDSSGPKLPLSAYFRPTKLKLDFYRQKKIEEQNLKLLRRINKIQRMKGQIDNYKTDYGGENTSLRAQEILDDLNKLKENNKKMAVNILKARPILSIRKKSSDESKKIKSFKEDTVAMSKFLMKDQQLCIFLNFAIKDGKHLGCLVLALFNKTVPKTTSAFMKMCEKSCSNSDSITIQRIFPNLYFQIADASIRNLCSGKTTKNDEIKPENYSIDHNHTGTLSMIPATKKMKSSFTITFRPLEILNGKRVAFGYVIEGLNTLKVIQMLKTESNGKPKSNVIIKSWGVLN